ncbi:MAG TPA: hypothetical protein VG917_00945 [Patescibacteria group bacterium]|nr:hypothetical protein [Patescibacteria group bacterium]
METIISGIASFLFFHFTTKPKSKINKKIPRNKLTLFKRVGVFPNLNFEAKNKVVHVHHWMVFTPLFIAAQTILRNVGFFQSDMLHGLMLGGIFQGLMYEDSLKFIHNSKDYKEKITSTSYHGFRFLKKLF